MIIHSAVTSGESLHEGIGGRPFFRVRIAVKQGGDLEGEVAPK